MSATVATLSVAAIEIAKLYMDYAARAQTMNLETAKAEWARVTQQAAQANARWDAGEPPLQP